jgi:proteic killer suppression protein
MDVAFGDDDLDRLETDGKFDAGFSPGVVKAFRKRMWTIRSAVDERLFYAMKSLHFEKLKGDREGQYSMRLNDQWRLVLEFDGKAPNKKVVVVSIEDYH